MVVDRAWNDHERTQKEQRTKKPDLVVTPQPPQTGYRYLPTAEAIPLARIGRQLPLDEADGEFVGMAMFSAAGAQTLCTAHQQAQTRDFPRGFLEADNLVVLGQTPEPAGALYITILSAWPVRSLRAFCT